MKKILITGSNGYIARNLIQYLSDYELVCINRSHFDMTDFDKVHKFFKNNFFDTVIHTCTIGGSRLQEDDQNVFINNFKMHQNIMYNHEFYNKYVSFGSGEELDKSRNIDFTVDLQNSFPLDYYGISKNYIAKTGYTSDKFVNLRVFNVFNHDELETRMIKYNIKNYIHGRPIVIHQDKYMDFFYIEDLAKIIIKVINRTLIQNEINCVYDKKYKLTDIANIINNLSSKKVDIIIKKESLGLSYIGKYTLSSNINYLGLVKGIQNTYSIINQKNNNKV